MTPVGRMPVAGVPVDAAAAAAAAAAAGSGLLSMAAAGRRDFRPRAFRSPRSLRTLTAKCARGQPRRRPQGGLDRVRVHRTRPQKGAGCWGCCLYFCSGLFLGCFGWLRRQEKGGNKAILTPSEVDCIDAKKPRNGFVHWGR